MTLKMIEEKEVCRHHQKNYETKSKRFRIVSEEDKYMWSLPEGMATHANDFFQRFIPLINR